MNLSLTASDLRGLAQLACDATLGVTGVVEQMHGTIRRRPLPLGAMRRRPDAGLAKVVYASIRATTRLVDRVVATAAAPWSAHGRCREAMVTDDPASAGSLERDAFLAALNGVFGDHLARSGNPLALPMQLRRPDAGAAAISGRWLLLVHGLCMNDRQWRRRGHDHGEALARDLGLTPLYLRYNSGLSVRENGVLLSALLERFLREQGGTAEELRVIGHSLGGLVVRSALVAAAVEGRSWPDRVRKLVFLGTPHAGAPLALGGHGLDRALELSPYSAAIARLGKARSRGLHDLRTGLGPDLGRLPPSLACYAVAGALVKRPGTVQDDVLGDGLVPVGSALAKPADSASNPALPDAHCWVARGLGHFDLLSDPAVYARIARWLG